MTNDHNEQAASRALHAATQDILRRFNESAPLDSLILELARHKLRLDELVTEVKVLAAQALVRDVLLPASAELYRGNDRVVVDAGMPLDGDAGFYPLEYDEQGRSFRWTGPQPVFRFDLHLQRSGPLEFVLVLNAGAGLSPEATRAFCDGAELPCEFTQAGHCVELSGVLPPRDTLGLTRIYFQPSQMFRPSDQGTGSDDRLLGLVFRELRVSPVDDDEAKRRLARMQRPPAPPAEFAARPPITAMPAATAASDASSPQDDETDAAGSSVAEDPTAAALKPSRGRRDAATRTRTSR